MYALTQDLRYAIRQIRRSPGFMFTAVLTLALGVGANTAIFSLLDQALLRALPVQDPGQLVVLQDTGTVWDGHLSDHGAGANESFSYPMYRDLRDRGTPFDGLLGTAPADVGITRNHASESAKAELVTGNYFNVLGVQPVLGRLFTRNDDTAPAANSVAVLGYNYWRSKLGSDPGIVGQTLSVNGHPFQVIGIAPEGFQSAVWGQVPDLFVPMSMLEQAIPGVGGRLEDHTDRWMNIVGRLKAGESREHAMVELAPLWHALRDAELKRISDHALTPHFIDAYVNGSHLKLAPGSRGLSYSRDDLEKPLLAVMAMALLVLLMASVNVASLLLVRSAGRVREFSVRYALGASARRVVQQLLLEGLILGVTGGAAGLLIAPACTRLILQHLDTGGGPSAFHTTLDPRLLAFNFAVAIFVSLCFSLAPAIQLLKPNIVQTLKQQTTTSGGPMLSLRGLIVSLQVGLSVLLLVAAGLFVRTMQNLRHVDTGLNPSHLVTFRINPQLSGYTPEQTPAIEQHILETMAALPGVEAVGATNDQELSGDGRTGDAKVEGIPAPPDTDYDVEKPSISPGYFQSLGIPLIAGRAFAQDDDGTHTPVAIVNETLARHFFGNPVTAIGHRISFDQGKEPKYMEIIGVARDARHSDLRQPVLPTVFTPIRQSEKVSELYLYLRTALPPEQSFSAIRQSMRQIDSALTVDGMRTMDDQIETTLTTERMIEILAIAFGLLATLLAGVGLYGVLAYATAQRTREIGIRIALGETRIGISKLVLAGVLRLAGIGIAVAVPCSILLGRLLKSQLYGISSADPITLIVVVVGITVVALIAAVIPARRAATINPTTALRAE